MVILISIISISAVSAADDANNTEIGVLQTTDELSVGGGISADDDLGDSNLVDDDNELSADDISVYDDSGEIDVLSADNPVDDEILTNDAPQRIILYIGQNNTQNEGNGSEENPYANLTLAWDKILSLNITSPTDIILNFNEGDYIFNNDFGGSLQVSEYMNITLQGVPNKEVNFLLYITDIFNLNNLIGIKYSNLNFILFNSNVLSNSFTVDKNFDVIIENCKFINGSRPLVFTAPASGKYVRIMNNCSFFNYNNIALITFSAMRKDTGSSVINYCTFYNCTGMTGQGNQKVWISASVMMATLGVIDANYIWWGSNSPQVKNYTNNAGNVVNIFTGSDKINNTIYAIYNTTFNYLGDNQFEIIGKLTWNDGTTKGIERLYDMPVSLVSSTGTFNDSNPILKDGNFRVIYTSNNLTNEITATLDREIQTLNFNTTDVIVRVNDITVGDYANVSVSVPANINGTITVTVNNKVYPIKTNQSSITISVDGLLAGNYTVDVLFIDEDNYLYGSNSTLFEVKKVEVANVDDVLNIPSTSDNVASFSINLPINATGNLTVFVNNKTYTKELVNGSATIDIADLPVGTYDTIVSYTGDGYYAPFTKNTTLTIKEATKPVTPTDKQSTNKKTTKLASKIIAKKKTFKAKTKVKKYTITLKAGKKPIKKVQVTLKIKGKKLIKAKTNNKGKATFKIKKLTKKFKYKAVIKFKGNKNYKSTTKKVKITVK